MMHILFYYVWSTECNSIDNILEQGGWRESIQMIFSYAWNSRTIASTAVAR